ncbi:MAG: 4Fe-4S dicluster domain-containing protein [Magnetococcales bacterium]|nr:4Fe-4S dicluster domain-containing protein [Magnetococcales bacterium]MBF0156654.1 4Fe-4S dicluster domain-containing protein [Magnetococcales bacterium]
MGAFLVRKAAVTEWIRSLAREQPLFFPQPVGRSGFRFQPLREGSEVRFDHYRPSVVPPGRQLTPAGEVLFRYRTGEGGVPGFESVLDASPRILAGVRPCDLRGIYLMDRVNREGRDDPHYLTRRANTAIIACDCLAPCDDFCFCETVGSLRWREGADLFLTSVDGDFLVEALTPLGESLLPGTGFARCEDVAGLRARAEEVRVRPFGRHFALSPERIAAILPGLWRSPVWENCGQRCLSCGSCNLVCPTCYCFDIQDDFDISDPSSGDRRRNWDGCLLPNFAEVAGGHNFRPQPSARQRHRVKRKFEYLVGRLAEGSFCVGCGRCGRQCTVGIDIFDIVSELVAVAEPPP